MKSNFFGFIKKSLSIFAAVAFIASGFFVPNVSAADTILGVTQISAVQTYATPGGGFAQGWKWVFDVTVPSNETILKMKFADWVGILGSIPAAGNIQFYSAQSTNALDEASAIGITGAGVYSGSMYINPNVDLNSTADGRQIQVVVEVQVPANAPGGSYSTSYGISTNSPTQATITIGNLTQTYDSTAKSVTVTTNPSGLATNVTYDGLSTPPVNAGPYTISATVTDPNYIGTASGSMTINPAAVTVTADPKTKVYDGQTSSDPALTYTFSPSPLFDGDSFTGALARTSGESVGPYAINQGTLVLSPNYSLNFTPSTFIITKFTPTVTWTNPADITYGTPLDVTQLDATASVHGTFSYTPVAGTVLDAGSDQTLSVTFTPDDSVDYAPVTQTVTINVNKATAVVTASDGTMVYKGNVPTITANYTPSVTPHVLPTCWTSATVTSPVGSYTSSCSGASDPNYDFTYVNGSVSVTKATDNITASSDSMTYGGTVPTITPIYNPNITPATQATCSTSATPTSQVGSYPSSCFGASDPNYTFTYTDGSVVVNPATANVTASSNTMTYGGTVPTITATYSSNIAPQNPATCSTAATSNSSVGSYASNCSGAVDQNYSFNYVPGSVFVTPAPLIITADNQSKVFGTVDPSFTFGYSGLVNNDTQTVTLPMCSVSGAHDDVGVYSITCSGAADGNYTISYLPGTLTVSKANQTVIFADLPDKILGQPDFTVSATGGASGNSITFAVAPASSCSVTNNMVHIVSAGACTITASQAGNSNYNAAPDVSKSFDISRDTVAPVITLNGSPEVYSVVDTTYTDAGATASDNIDGDITKEIVTNNPVKTTVLGDYTVTYNVSDSSGNPALQVTRIVHIVTATHKITMITIPTTGGSIAIVANNGSDQTLDITPATGYHIVDVSVDGTSVGAVSSYTFYDIVIDHTISATFAINPAWNSTVALNNNVTATGAGTTLTASLVAIPTGGTTIQFNNSTVDPFNVVPSATGKIPFELTSTGTVDLNAYYTATKGANNLANTVWGQYLIDTLPAAGSNQTAMFYITYDGTNYKILDGTQNSVGVASDMLIPADFPTGTYTLTGTVNGTLMTVILNVTNAKGWTAPAPTANLVLTAPSDTTITKSTTLISETNGLPTDNSTMATAINGVTPIKVTLQNTGNAASPNVRINPIGASSHIQLWAEDTTGQWYDINVTGWGPAEGFPVPAPYNVTTYVYPISDTVDDYPLTANLQQVNPSSIVASASGTVHVVAQTQTTTPAWNSTVALNGGVTANGGGANLTATLPVTGDTTIQFSSPTVDPFNVVPSATGKIPFELTSTGTVDLNAYYTATKGANNLANTVWGQYLIDTLPAAGSNQTAMFYINYDGSNYSVIDGTQDHVGNTSAAQAGLGMPANFPVGTYTLTGNVNGTTLTITFTITNANGWVPPAPTVPVSGVTLNKTSETLVVGGTDQLVATIAPSNATNQNVTWSSDTPSVATVDNNGNVTAVVAGSATITVKTADGGQTATDVVTVNPVVLVVTKLKITDGSSTIVVNATSSVFRVEPQDQLGNPINAPTGGIKVNLSSNSGTGLFSDASWLSPKACNNDWGITSVTISSGDAHKSFCYKDSTVGTPTITVSSGSLISGTQAINITAN